MKENKTSIEKQEKAIKIASKSNTRSVYESLEESVLKFFRWTSSIIDRLFFSSRYSALFALLLACLAYFVATYDSHNSTLTSSKVLSNVSINTRYNSETFELSGVPSACEIVLTGEAANVNNAAARKGYCQLNLEGYAEGTHTVKLSALGYGDNVSTIVSPSEVTVSLKKKTTMQFDLSYDFVNQNAMDSKFILGTPTFAQGVKINIRASQDTLNSIALVKALIDCSGAVGDFTTQAPLVAYDSNGQVVNAEIVPSTIQTTVSVSSPSKEVSIKLNPIGQVPSGLAIDSVVITDHQATTIYGPQNVISAIDEVYVNFDMATVTENADLEMMLPVTVPSGVRALDITVVNVRVTLDTIDTITIEDVPLNAIDNTNNLAISDIDIKEVNVGVSGSNNNVSQISIDDIMVYFEMPKEAGTYDLPLYVKAEAYPYVNLTLDKLSVHITVVEANS